MKMMKTFLPFQICALFEKKKGDGVEIFGRGI